MYKSFRLRQKVFVLGNGNNLLPKNMILTGKIMFFEPTAMPLQWFFKEHDETDTLHRIFFPKEDVISNFYSKHIFLTKKEAETCALEREKEE